MYAIIGNLLTGFILSMIVSLCIDHHLPVLLGISVAVGVCVLNLFSVNSEHIK